MASHTGALRAHVLVVDDEATVRRFTARVLCDVGCQVSEAADGEEALSLVRQGASPVDVVVTDIVMPRVNGVELLRQLAASHPRLPVILMSGYAAADLTGLGISPPCAVLGKPFPAERLVEEVRRCLQGMGRLAASG